MATVAKEYQDQLPRIKKAVEDSRKFYDPNYKRFHMVRNFVFRTGITQQDEAVLTQLGKPVIEFNILEAYISRLLGEFSKQEPSINVTASDEHKIDPEMIDFVEGHLKAIIEDANADGCEYNAYKDTLSGGFSALKVWTEYCNEMSMNQDIKLGVCYDPTMVGFDPLARKPDKRDGRITFELYPKTANDLVEMYPDLNLDSISFTKTLAGFNWSYRNGEEDIALVCEYYERKKKKTKIVKLSDGQTMTMKDYKEFLQTWGEEGRIEQPPIMVGKPRMTDLSTICRYIFIESQVLEYTETDYYDHPYIPMLGNTVNLRESSTGGMEEFSKPYIFHAIGAQRLRNFAGQTLANELENMVQSKLMAAKESIPPEYREDYENLQIPTVILYNAFYNNDPTMPVPPPQVVPRVGAPPEVTNTFSMTESMIQNTLGSFDAALGINDNQLSGIAIQEGATQSNAAAMPFVVGYLQAWTAAAQRIVDLMPKYYTTPRTVPVIGRDGKRSYVKINQPGNQGLQVNYKKNALSVRVEAGVNFSIQKTKALQQLIAMMQASPMFAQFMNQEGLDDLLENMEIKGIDQLKVKADAWMVQQKQMQAQQAQMQQQQAQQPNPLMLKHQLDAAKFQHQVTQDQTANQLRAVDMSLQKEDADNDRLKILAGLQQAHENNVVQVAKTQTERLTKGISLAMQHADQQHQQAKDNLDFHQGVLDQQHQHNMDALNLAHSVNTQTQQNALQSAQPDQNAGTNEE